MTTSTDETVYARAGLTLGARLGTVVTREGLEFWLVEDRSRPMVTIAFGFKGGASQDPVDKPGLSAILAAMLQEGAGTLDAAAFQAALDDEAIELAVSADRDSLRGTVKTLSRHAPQAFTLLGLALTEPRFDQDALERVSGRMAGMLRYQANDPEVVSQNLFARSAFADHPYARPSSGDLDMLTRVTCADVRAMHRRVITRDTLRIAIVGDIDATTAALEVDRILATLPATANLSAVPEATFEGLGSKGVTAIDIPQSTIRFGRPGLGREDRDVFAAMVVNHVFGGGIFSSRLFRELREKRGLCYSVYSENSDFDHAAVWAGVTAVKNESVGEALDVIAGEIECILRDGLSEPELAGAKRYLIGSYALRFDSSAKIASVLLSLQLTGRDVGWMDSRNARIDAVTLDDAERATHRLFQDSRLLVSIAGRPC